MHSPLLQPVVGREASMRSSLRGARDIRGIGEERVRMRANVAPSKAAACAYNPDGGKRVQQAWQRFSTSQRWSRSAPVRPEPGRSSAWARYAPSGVPVSPAACR
ncbi:hypothetical protein GCM10010273_54770 [Streptomyces lavendulocolor]